jgi:hypothetical protein
MTSAVGTLRLKLNESAESQLAKSLRVSDATIGRVGPRMLASLIASHTVSPEQVVHDCILRFSMPEEEKLAMAVNWLNGHAHLHRWEIAHRIAPPKTFYQAHPEILEACKMCGAVVLDAGTPATITTGSINPLAGAFLANWIQSALEVDPTETRPRFFFHVVIPPQHWEAIARAHFRTDYGI